MIFFLEGHGTITLYLFVHAPDGSQEGSMLFLKKIQFRETFPLDLYRMYIKSKNN